jgi:lysophospholipase L1-like esterase
VRVDVLSGSRVAHSALAVGRYAWRLSRSTILALSLALLIAVHGHSTATHSQTRILDSVANRVAVISDSYTTGTDQGGLGPKNWTTVAWRQLAAQGLSITPDVQAEGRAGYFIRGNRGHVFDELTAAAVKPDDTLVVFFGSRNDMDAEPIALANMINGAFQRARLTAPSARLLVIGPAWPTADPPASVLRIRDTLAFQAGVIGATFVDPIAQRWFVGRPYLIGPDGVHPTDAGHTYLAGKIAPLIGAQLLRQA